MNQNLDKNFKLLIIGPVAPPTGGDTVWLKSYSDYLLSVSTKFRIINTSIIGSRLENKKFKYNLMYEFLRCMKIWLLLLYQIITFKPAIIHFNSNCSSIGLVRDYISISIINLFSIPLILHCHANIPSSIYKSRIGRYFLIKCMVKSTCIYVLNRRSLRYVSVFSGDNCFIMPNFIDKKYIINNKKVNDEVKNIIFVGHIIKSKGIFELLEAAKSLTHINFTCAGLVLTELKSEDIPRNVKFVGDVSRINLLKLYSIADIFVFPTYNEGFSMALLEAMAMGLPVITTRVGANYDILGKDGGVFVKVKSVRQIINAVNYLGDRRMRNRYSINNINKVKLNYTSDTIIPLILNHYNLIISENWRLQGRIHK